MLGTFHVLAGLAIGKAVPNPLAAFALGVVSHYVLDAVPHWDGNEPLEGTKKDLRGLGSEGKYIIAFDMATALIAGLFLAWKGAFGTPLQFSVAGFWSLGTWIIQNRPSFITGVGGALFPDFLNLFRIIFGWSRPAWLFRSRFHKRIQAKEKRLWLGLATQVIAGAALVVFLITFH